jgi:hypothetical protein
LGIAALVALSACAQQSAAPPNRVFAGAEPCLVYRNALADMTYVVDAAHNQFSAARWDGHALIQSTALLWRGWLADCSNATTLCERSGEWLYFTRPRSAPRLGQAWSIGSRRFHVASCLEYSQDACTRFVVEPDQFDGQNPKLAVMFGEASAPEGFFYFAGDGNIGDAYERSNSAAESLRSQPAPHEVLCEAKMRSDFPLTIVPPLAGRS